MRICDLPKYQGFVQIEYPNRLRIFQESQNIMKTTNNLDVFERRSKEVLDFIIWACDKKEKGYPVSINMSKAEGIEDFNKFYNSQLLRIALHIKNMADSPLKKKNAIKKVEALKEKIKDSQRTIDDLEDIITTLQNHLD